MAKRLLVAVFVMVLSVARGEAEIALTGGRSAHFTDAPSDSGDAGIIRFARDPQLDPVVDPSCPTGSTLRLTTSNYDSGTITLDCTFWNARRHGFRYDDRTAAVRGGRRIEYKPGELVIKLRGTNYAAITGPVGFVDVRFAIGSSEYCGRFSEFKTNRPDRITAVKPSAACPIYTGWYNGQDTGVYGIGRATSAVMMGTTWTRDRHNPLIRPQPTGWDSESVVHPFAIRVGNTTFLYYAGRSETVDYQLGLYESTDGGWTFSKLKSGHCSFSTATACGVDADCPRHEECIDGGLILGHGPGGSFDDSQISFPAVVYDVNDDDPTRRWKLWYVAKKALGGKWRIGYAYSGNGETWTKSAATAAGCGPGCVLNVDAAGAWDDGLVDSPTIFRSGSTWYLYFDGCRVNNKSGNKCQVGHATFTDPEGWYTKAAGNPILTRRAAANQPLASDLLAGQMSLVVSDVNVFTESEPVIIRDDFSPAQINRIVSISDGTISLLDAASQNYTTAGNAQIRSLFYESVCPSFIFNDGTALRMNIVGFQAFNDFDELIELAAQAIPNCPSPPCTDIGSVTSWSYDYPTGVLLEPDSSVPWDSKSAENLRLEFTAQPTHTATLTPLPSITPTPTDTATPT